MKIEKYNEYINESVLDAMKPKSKEDIDKTMGSMSTYNKIKHIKKYGLDKGYITKNELDYALQMGIKNGDVENVTNLILYDNSLLGDVPSGFFDSIGKNFINVLGGVVYISELLNNTDCEFKIDVDIEADILFCSDVFIGNYSCAMDIYIDTIYFIVMENIAEYGEECEYDTSDNDFYIKPKDVKQKFKPMLLESLKKASEKDRKVAKQLNNSLSELDNFIKNIK